MGDRDKRNTANNMAPTIIITSVTPHKMHILGNADRQAFLSTTTTTTPSTVVNHRVLGSKVSGMLAVTMLWCSNLLLFSKAQGCQILAMTTNTISYKGKADHIYRVKSSGMSHNISNGSYWKLQGMIPEKYSQSVCVR